MTSGETPRPESSAATPSGGARPKSVLATRLTFWIPILSAVIGLLALDHFRGGFIGIGVLAVVFGLGAVIEFARMTRLGKGMEWASAFLVLALLGVRAALLGETPTDAAGAIPSASHFLGVEADLLILALSPVLLVFLLLRRPLGEETLRVAATTLFGVAYIGLPLVCLLELAAATEWGIGALLFLVLVVKGNDSGAYLIGRKWGRTPLTAVSPKKTREGAIGGLVVGTAIGAGLALAGAVTPFSLGAAIAVAAGIGVAGQLGDLVESALKRSAGVKDSGALIPAFGGILDLLDSLLFAGPLLLALVHLAR